jgi:hypothetical protein
MSIEGLIEFIIFGYLNAVTREFTMNGEILGFVLVSMYTSGLILPLILIVLIVMKKKEKV